MKFKQYKQSQKIRIIINGVSFWSTAKQVREGVGSSINVNACCWEALNNIEVSKRAGEPITGLCGIWAGHQIQMDVL